MCLQTGRIVNTSNRPPPEFYEHDLIIGFHDKEGNDLVNGIGYFEWEIRSPWEYDSLAAVDLDLYKLDAVYPEHIVHPWKTLTGTLKDNGTCPRYLGLCKQGDSYYLVIFGVSLYEYWLFDTRCPFGPGLFSEWISYQLTYPYVFGNKETHQLVTYSGQTHEKIILYPCLTLLRGVHQTNLPFSVWF